MTDSTAFVKIEYRIDQSRGAGTGENRLVRGFAFQAAGWPEFHACVRRGGRYQTDWDGCPWIVDHFETGLALSEAGGHETKEAAAKALADLLNKKGKKKVYAALRKWGLK